MFARLRFSLVAALLAALALALPACDDGGSDDAGGDASTDVLDGASTDDTETNAAGEPATMAGITSAHNAVRQGVDAGLPDLTWSPELAAYAQEWADELAASFNCDLQHRPSDGPFAQQHGENLFWGSGNGWTVQDVVGAWADEVQYYDYDTNTCSLICGHYTQIVWRDSTELGCARATCGQSQVWVCNYDPPGNFIGRKPY